MYPREEVMPTYQYQCSECGEALEVVQSFSDDALTECPSCAQPALKKVYGSVGVVFKGSGFYRTDSRSTSSSSTPATPSSSATTSGSAPTASPAPSTSSSTPPAS